MADNSLTTDADPKPPRSSMNEQTADPQQISSEQTAMDRQIQRDTQAPTADWKFKHFLVKLAGEITDGDLEKLKIIFSGDGGLGQGILSKLETPLQFFTKLEQRCWLTPNNLLKLQTALKTINRMDLVKTAAEYAQSIDNTLHFHPASNQPENGYRSVKFHIRGHDYQNATREVIQQFRMSISELIFASPEDIIIAGVEPSTSLILTLYIPEAYAELLKDMLEANDDHPRFKDIGIDLIDIQHVAGVFHLKETEKAKTTVREQHTKLYNVYQQLENTKKQLEVTEIEQLELQNRIQEYEKERFEREALLKTMKTKLLSSVDDNQGPASCSDDLVEFEKQLQRPEFESYDKALILSLIDINTKVVANAVSEGYKTMEEKMKLAMKELEAKIQPLQFELLKLRAFSSPHNDEKILEMFRILAENIQVTQQVTVQINGDFLQILKKISRGLRSKEREKLAKNYDWTPNEPLKQAIDNDSSVLLAAILHKEIERTNTLVDEELFILQRLEAVGRADLKTKFQNSMVSLKNARSAAERIQQKRNRQRSKSLERDDDTDARMSKDQVQKMAAQVAQMHDIIVSAHESIQRPSYVGFPPSPKRCLFESKDGDRFV